MPENIIRTKNVKYDANLLDILQAYARVRTKDEFKPYVFQREKVYSMKEALERLKKLIIFAGDWTELSSYLPESLGVDRERRKSANPFVPCVLCLPRACAHTLTDDLCPSPASVCVT